MNTLVWVEHDNASVKDATLSAVTAAAQLGEVHMLVAGAGIGGMSVAYELRAALGKEKAAIKVVRAASASVRSKCPVTGRSSRRGSPIRTWPGR